MESENRRITAMKTDHGLGKNIHSHLMDKGVETPMNRNQILDRKKNIEAAFYDIMKTLELDL